MDRGNRHSNSPRRVDRYRDKGRIRPSPYQKDDFVGRRPGGNHSPPYHRVFVSNIPYDEKWQGIKDLFREKVGEVTYVELVTDDTGNSRGYGIIEFKTKQLAEDAVEKMKGHEINKRKIVVKPDYNGDVLSKAMMRDGIRGQHDGRGRGRGIIPSNMPPPMPMPGMPPPMPRHMAGPPPPMDMHVPPPRSEPHGGNLGMNEQLLQDITGGGPIGNTIFVANLDYNVTYSKLKEVFKLAGNVVKVDVHLDKDNKSRGMATVTYETPMEAVQSISMFHKQLLYDRPMMVKMDKDNARMEKKELPSGLQSIGPSLNLGNIPPMSEPPRRGSPPIMPGRMDSRNSLTELERLTAQRNLLESGLNGNLSNYSNMSNNQLNTSNIPAIPGLSKSIGSVLNSNTFGMNLPGLGQQSNPLSNALSSNRMGSGFGGYDSMGGGGGVGSDVNRLSATLGAGNRMGLDNSLDDRFLNNTRVAGLGITDRERIEIDIARVDSRIRDLDRSLAAVEDRKASIIHQSNSREPQNANCTVFVRNLPFSLPWQKLRDKFSRIGNVQFAEIKTENGRSKGFGHVRFETPEQAQVAIRHFDGIDIDGRKIEVRLNEDKYGQRR